MLHQICHPTPYYAIVYLCRKDLIKGEKEVSYLFYSALIKVYALVHTTTNYHIAAIESLFNKKSSNQLSAWSTPIIRYDCISTVLFWIINMNSQMYFTHLKLVANYLESLGKVFVCYQNWPIFRLLLFTELPLKKWQNEK